MAAAKTVHFNDGGSVMRTPRADKADFFILRCKYCGGFQRADGGGRRQKQLHFDDFDSAVTEWRVHQSTAEHEQMKLSYPRRMNDRANEQRRYEDAFRLNGRAAG